MNIIRSRALLLALTLAASVTIPGVSPVAASTAHGGSATGGQITVTAFKRHVRLVLQLQGGVYPSNALVPVTLRLTNFSARPVYTWDRSIATFRAVLTVCRAIFS